MNLSAAEAARDQERINDEYFRRSREEYEGSTQQKRDEQRIKQTQDKLDARIDAKWSAEPLDFLRQTVAPGFHADEVLDELGQYATEWAAAAGFDPSGYRGDRGRGSGGALRRAAPRGEPGERILRESATMGAARRAARRCKDAEPGRGHRAD